jgi:uncharacterized protein YuzE
MRITYSEGADAVYVELATNQASARTQEIVPGVLADLDAAGRVLGLEILDASRWYPRTELEALETPVEWLTLAQAAVVAAELGEPIQPATLRSQVAKGKLQADKRGRDLVVARHELLNYLGRRSPQGRRAGGATRQGSPVGVSAAKAPKAPRPRKRGAPS